ncbi:hypothetical protein PIB30_088949 [Stylosanthes scabra]|uniref:Uncharacterized protein n=1 Tax=Stylosanthes scabra TaxID=79078 RepID=A0ABU6QW94_9FABA|nr:hypothetical protein [Stylosanthes scabra]
MNAAFERFMVLNRSHVPIKLPIEGYRLAHLELNFNVKGDEVIDHFWFVFTKLLKSRTFEGGDLNFTPFARRQIGPNWFRQRRVKEEGKTEAQLIVDKHWSKYLAVQVLPIGFPSYKKDRYKIVHHSPHFMARQMGFSQAIPAPYSTDPAQQIFHLVPHSFREIKIFLFDNLLTRTFYDPIPCRSRMESERSSFENHLCSRKTPTPESARSASVNSLDVSSKSKESSNSKDKRASPEKQRTEEPTARESTPSLNVIVGEEQSPRGLSSEGYSISNLSRSAKKSNPILDEIDQALNNPVGKMNSLLEEQEIIQEASTPKVPIQAGSNQGTQIDPRIQFKEKLEETRVASVEKVKQSMKPLPSIPVIDLDGGDPDLADLLQMISESKIGSEPDISNSVNKTIPQEKEKEETPIQKARSEALQKILLKSAAEKMIRFMDQLLDMLQKDPYWNDELIKVTSCLVERQFPKKYRDQVLCFGKIFENLFITREKLSNVRLKVAMIQENSNGLIIAKEDLVKKLAGIQAQIQDVDAKMTKLKKPFEKIQEKKTELGNQLSEIEKNKLQNEADLKRLQEEELQEIDLFKGFEDNKIQLKDTLEECLREIGE